KLEEHLAQGGALDRDRGKVARRHYLDLYLLARGERRERRRDAVDDRGEGSGRRRGRQTDLPKLGLEQSIARLRRLTGTPGRVRLTVDVLLPEDRADGID